MTTTNNPIRKSILMVIVFIFVFMSFTLLACDENPCQGLNDTACGLTAPHSNTTQSIIDWVEDTDPQGDTNNW
jgi:hypothetical protein